MNMSENEQPLAVAIVGHPRRPGGAVGAARSIEKGRNDRLLRGPPRELIFSGARWRPDGGLPGSSISGRPARQVRGPALAGLSRPTRPNTKRWCDPLAIEITRD